MKNKQITLEKVIKAAVHIFMKKGYLGTSMREIASTMGIKAGSLYYHIRSKEELLEKIHDVLIGELLEESKKIISDKNINAKKKFELFTTDLLRIMAYFQPYATVFFRDYHFLSPQFSNQIKKNRENYQEIFRVILREGIKNGEFRNMDVKMTSMGIFGMFMWSYMWIKKNGRLKIEEIAKIFCNTLFRGIDLPRNESLGLKKRQPHSIVRKEPRASVRCK
jgi:TetR/AcrR family transcriptional regulator, cholesterol catabolism regulator